MDIFCFMSIITYILVPSLRISSAVDYIAVPHNLSDGNTLISEGGTFELGFFCPGSSQKRYLGIWYKNIPVQTVVWVANRLNPINGSSGVLAVKDSGNLVLTQNGTVVWHTALAKQAQHPMARLLDTGNLVVRDENATNPEAYLWQSFDYPSDTLLPGMKFGCDLVTGLNKFLTSWKSWDDPSPGDFSWVMEPRALPESYFMKGNEKYYRSGPWNGLLTSGSPYLASNPIFNPDFESNEREVYYSYTLKNSFISTLVMNQSHYNVRLRYLWSKSEQNWKVNATVPRDLCDNYAQCGANGYCIITQSPICQCLIGFKPKSPERWNVGNWSEGCVPNVPVNCKDKGRDEFEKLIRLKLPETTHACLNQTLSLEQCREKCLNNCSCTAYANSNINGEDYGCAMWFGNLIDIRQFDANGQNLYVRVAASESDAEQRGSKKKLTIIVAISITIAAISGMLLLGCYFINRVRRKRNEYLRNIEGCENGGESEDDLELPLFDLSTLVVATDNFSGKNKIGEGGFGPVYKGRLVNGKDIAVKKLSKSSGQGMTEFKNEVKLIAKLQHRNLVRLLGCCIQGEESQDKMLVYEYMPNRSLDYFIFDDKKGKELNWSMRFHIICGIARGLLYLHEDSRLRIIHRDLKTSNILLDEELNPKISDFGMAKAFEKDQIEGNTKRVVGTYGYMLPEYAADGLFSIKSDVFSFGVLLLEIISGKKNKGFYYQDHTKNLVSQAWILWEESRALELVDEKIEGFNVSEVLRCIHISLLCVQQHPGDRPTVSSVVVMLGSEIKLGEPKQPGFFPGKDYAEVNSSSSQRHSNSTNKMTVTLIQGR